MNIAPYCPTLPIRPSTSFLQNLRKTPGRKLGWKGFKTYNSPAIAIYHIQTPLDSYHGIITLTSVDDFLTSKVLPHEKTLVKREKSTLHRLQQNQGMYKPILLTYHPNEDIDRRSRLFTIDHPPDFIYSDAHQQSRHLMWLVKDPLEQKIFQKLFKSIPYCYLADGHHRAKSIMRWQGDENAPKHILTAYFDLDEVRVSPYNRVILKGLRANSNFEKRIKKYVKILHHRSEPPQQKGTLLIVMNHKTLYCRWRKSVLKKAAENHPALLDTFLLNEFLLKKALGLKKIRSNRDIAYIEGQGGVGKVLQKVQEHSDHIGFCLFPILEKDFVACSKASLMLPPKSTWFRPRLPGGLICQRF